MSLELRWVGEGEWDRVARARLLCYAGAASELPVYAERLRADPRNVGADILLAETDGEAVGTATAMPLTLWARGGAVPCQGVAYVGTIKTHRRGGSAGEPGVATRVMWDVLRMAREREQVVSALMPFRASFYEKFGYGLVERRNDWTLPLAVLPRGGFGGVRFYDAADFDALVACRQRVAEQGQCDMERSPEMWRLWLSRTADGLMAVDRPHPGGPVQGWIYFKHSHEAGKDILRVPEIGYEDLSALLRLLHFIGSLRDQYAAAVLSLPADLPLNRLLTETQIPHRPVNHATAEARAYTRMQVRVLDHARFVAALRLPPGVRGKVAVAVHECEGHPSRFVLELADGQAVATPAGGEAGFECNDATWAAVVCGDLRATAAVELGLATCPDRAAAELLDAFAAGPVPFCGEYF